MKIALAQLKIDVDMEVNSKKSTDFIEKAVSMGAELICFPELQFSPFFPQHQNKDAAKYLMSVDHPSIKAVQTKCKEYKIAACLNVYLREDKGFFDASPFINSHGEIMGISKMVHIVQWPKFYEQDYYTPSDEGFNVYETENYKAGVVICFDRHFPESLRTCALIGAELIIVPTAIIKDEPLEMFEWEMRIAAMQNNVFIALCNRVGKEGEMDFAGMSLVVDPLGNVVAKAEDREQLLIADMDLKVVKESRIKNPFIEMRRPDKYL